MASGSLGLSSSLIDDCEHKPLLLYSSYYRFDTSKCLAIKRFSTWPISPKVLIRLLILCLCLLHVYLKILYDSNVHFQPVSHEDYIFGGHFFDNVPTSSIIVDTNALAYYTISPESLSGNKFRALRWLLSCYEYFGYNFTKKYSLCFCEQSLS